MNVNKAKKENTKMNSFMYDDGSDADEYAYANDVSYWDELFDISQALKVMGLHK